MEREGLLRIVNQYPHAMPMEDHLVRMGEIIEEFQPQRVAVDSLSALERVVHAACVPRIRDQPHIDAEARRA